MGKAKGKVDEKSLDNLKKKLKAGGDRKKEKKPVTPRPRSRSRSRGRPRKATPPPPKKEPAARKSRSSAVKVKRLDDKPATTRKSTAVRGAKAAVAENSIKQPSYRLRSRVSTSAPEVLKDLSTSDKKDSSSTLKTSIVNGTSGWLSKCVIM